MIGEGEYTVSTYRSVIVSCVHGETLRVYRHDLTG